MDKTKPNDRSLPAIWKHEQSIFFDGRCDADIQEEHQFQADTAHLSEEEYKKARAERTREKKWQDAGVIGLWVFLALGAFLAGLWIVGVIITGLLIVALYRTR